MHCEEAKFELCFTACYVKRSVEARVILSWS